MLPSQVRRRVDAIWDRIWASGVSNPLTAIEYFSTVLLLRRLNDQAELDSGAPGDRSTWDTLVGHIDDGDAGSVAALMLRVQTQFGIGASPDVASPSTWRDLGTLKAVLREVRDLDLTDRNHDRRGKIQRARRRQPRSQSFHRIKWVGL